MADLRRYTIPEIVLACGNMHSPAWEKWDRLIYEARMAPKGPRQDGLFAAAAKLFEAAVKPETLPTGHSIQ